MHAKPGARRPPRPAADPTEVGRCCRRGPRWRVGRTETPGGSLVPASHKRESGRAPGSSDSAEPRRASEASARKKKKEKKSKFIRKIPQSEAFGRSGERGARRGPPPSRLWVWPAVGKPALGSGRGCAHTLGLVVHTLPVTSMQRRRCSVEAATDSTGSTGSDGRAGLAQNFGAEGVTSTHHDGHLAICINTEALCCTAETDRARR